MKYPPLKFGTEEDFEAAKIELHWIQSRRKLLPEDFEKIAEKYNFPVDFLIEGINGLKLDDYIISKSKWYPIIYSWHFSSNESHRKLARLCVDYLRANHFFKRFLIYVMAIIVYFSIIFLFYLNRSIEELLITAVFPIALFAFEIGIELKGKVSEKKSARDEYAREMSLTGKGKNAEKTIGHINKHKFIAVYAPSKIVDPIQLSLFSLDSLEGKEFESIKKKTRKEKSLIFFGENPYEAYEGRIEQLLKKSSKIESEENTKNDKMI